MQWLELNFETTHEAAELLTDFLSGLGADGVQVKDAAEIREILAQPDSLTYADDDFMHNLDPVVVIKAYFAQFPEGVRRNREIPAGVVDLYDDVPKIHVPLADLEQYICEKLAGFTRFLDIGPGYTGCQVIREEDWADGWKKYYETIHLTDRLVINPSWIDYQPAPAEMVISLDPGSAFGTGTHETTALCAEFLDQLMLPEMSVLDLGCGSGILAIIAAKLGSKQVEAIDIDRLAVNVSQDNCRLNQAAVDCHQGELKDARQENYDLIVANIIADVIAAIAADIPARLSPAGLFITSGIIHDKAERVRQACQDAGLVLLMQAERHDWHAFVWQLSACRLG